MNFTRRMATATIALGMALNGGLAYAGEALDRVKSAGMLTVASDANWAPQSFLNDKNEMDGFDIDVAREIAKRMEVGVEFVTPAWDIITAGNWHGRWDISVGSMTPTKSRAEVLSFPGVYYYTPASVAVHSDSAATAIADLNGKTMGACTSCTFELYLQKDLTIDAVGVPGFDYQITAGKMKSYKDSAATMDDLRLGDGVRLDGLVGSLPAILEAIDNGYPFKVLGDPVFFEPLSVAIDIGDAEFTELLAGIVADMHADGTLSALSIKWFGTDFASTN